MKEYIIHSDKYGNKQKSLGYFKNKEEAIKAREDYIKSYPW